MINVRTMGTLWEVKAVRVIIGLIEIDGAYWHLSVRLINVLRLVLLERIWVQIQLVRGEILKTLRSRTLRLLWVLILRNLVLILWDLVLLIHDWRASS